MEDVKAGTMVGDKSDHLFCRFDDSCNPRQLADVVQERVQAMCCARRPDDVRIPE
jgi:hypothetical protein